MVSYCCLTKNVFRWCAYPSVPQGGVYRGRVSNFISGQISYTSIDIDMLT